MLDRLRILAVSLAGVLCWAAGPSSAGAERPAETTIVPDGDLADWETVLTNPLNTARDDDGHSISCAFSADRDCGVGGREHDLARFAWTWSGTDWAFYLQRYGNSGGWEWFWIYLDTDDDGLLETGEPLLRLRLNGDGRDNDLEKLQYVSAVPAVGDPLADVQGFADGHDLQGTSAGPSILLSADLGAHPDGLRYEGLVSTAFLGVPPGSPMGFHVAASSNNNIPGSLEDNMGGPGGGPGTTAYRLVTAGPDSERSSGPGLTHFSPVSVCNEGNLTATLDFSSTSLRGYDLSYWRDSEPDGQPDTYLGRDAGGDGDLTRAQDDLAPAGDSNADFVMDTGPLAAGECRHLLIEQSFPNNANGSTETVTLTARDGAEPSILDEAVIRLELGHLTLVPDRTLRVQDGDTAWLAHVVTNNTPDSERVDFQSASARGWVYSFWYDPNGDGDPADAVPLVDSDGTGLPDLVVPSMDSVPLLVSGLVPAGTADGQADSVAIRALIGGNARAVADDRVEVIPPIALSPDHLLADGNERYGAAGGSVYFPHRLLNGRGVSDVFTLNALSDAGWATQVLSDPNGDGRPFDSEALSPAELAVPGGGGVGHFIVRVDVPAGSATGTSSRVQVTAAAQGDPAVADAAENDAITAIVRVYEDANHVVQLRDYAPCSTVHALASGLPPSTGGFRFAWRDGGGALVQAVSVATNAVGECDSSYDLAPSDGGVGWTVDIDAWDAGSGVWLTQDTALFDVVSEVRALGVTPAEPAYHLSGANLAAEAALINDGAADLFDLQLRWVVLSGDRSSFLRPNGAWAAYSGVEATQVDTVNRLNAGQTRPRTFSLAAVDFPSAGSYPLELHVAGACGGEALAGSSSFVVVDDEDRDGLSRDEELAAGTDPADADSDDDGLLDGLDGTGDSDGDGRIDALDCDSDDDGLTDGLEAGVWYRHEDTDAGSPCARLDLWPGSTTDPDAADTDGGGVPDGLEDADGNGRRDEGETDPRDAADDALVDSDGDGVTNLVEDSDGTDPLDPDSDDDGLGDGAERGRDSDGDGTPDALECDSDGDGLPDGLEAGLTAAPAGTDVGAGCFVADADPGTTTDPRQADTDGAGVPDGVEDLNRNGAVDPGETDPRVAADDDSDLDGLPNLEEDLRGTDRFDRDSDDDGLLDGEEGALDTDGDGLIDALDCDSDDDGLPDGLEAGLTAAPAGTDVGAGCFVADAEPGTTTDPRQADTDGAGVPDGVEDLNRNGAVDPGETDPRVAADDDSDLDGLPNLEEDLRGTDRFDRDSDDDGLLDGEEGALDTDGDGLIDALDCDSDDDGLPDGLEAGRTAADADTDPAADCFVADADPATTTDPLSADSDGAGVLDGDEDADRDGRVDPGETDPNRADDDDSDGDGLPNLQEDLILSDRFDRDSDDDGLLDGEEPVRDSDGDGVYDALECDADGDGLPDGLEVGLVSPDADTDTAAGCWRPDADPATTTDPTSADSDGGGVADGVEDANGNGRHDAGERDPALTGDDGCSTDRLPAIEDLRVRREPGGDVRLEWTGSADACATYTAWAWGDQADRPVLAQGLTQPRASDPGVFRPGPLVFYSVAAVSSVSGLGEGAP